MKSEHDRAGTWKYGSEQPPSSVQADAPTGAAQAAAGAKSPPESKALREGWRLYGRGSLAEARRLIMLEAAHAPDDPEAAYLLGLIFKARGEVDNAGKAFAAVTRTADRIRDRIRSDMLRRLAEANLGLLHPASDQESNEQS
jgi:thioredoxin-like negative regulator of GroEL